MAGQPQEPPWQSFPTTASEQQDSYTYPPPPPGAAPPSGQVFGQSAYAQQPGQGYPGPSYTSADQGGYQAAGGQDTYLGAPDQGYPGPQGPSTPQWQAVPGMSAGGAARAKGDAKGFLGALFDFSFTSFVTPKIVKVLYVLITAWTLLWALIFLRYGFKYGGAAGGFFTLFVVDPILILLTLGAYRVVLELFMVVHRMHEDLKAIRERGEGM